MQYSSTNATLQPVTDKFHNYNVILRMVFKTIILLIILVMAVLLIYMVASAEPEEEWYAKGGFFTGGISGLITLFIKYDTLFVLAENTAMQDSPVVGKIMDNLGK